jgi:hypothetical protein
MRLKRPAPRRWISTKTIAEKTRKQTPATAGHASPDLGSSRAKSSPTPPTVNAIWAKNSVVTSSVRLANAQAGRRPNRTAARAPTTKPAT